MDVTFVIGNNSWKFDDDTMMGTWSKSCQKGVTDRQTEKPIHSAAKNYAFEIVQVCIYSIGGLYKSNGT